MKLIDWIKDNLCEMDYQHLNKNLRWEDEDNIFNLGYSPHKRKHNVVEEKCHCYWDSVTFFKIGNADVESNYYTFNVRVNSTRILYYLKGTPKFLRNLLSMKDYRLNLDLQYTRNLNMKYNLSCPMTVKHSMELSWLRFRYSNELYNFLEERVNGLQS